MPMMRLLKSKVVWAMGAVALLLLVFLLLSKEEQKDDRRNQEIGVAKERQEVQEKVIERVEKANEVRATATPGSDVLYRECMRSARTPASCQRFLPSGQGDQR